MLSETDRRILERLAGRLREEYPQARIWAFGSGARGDAEEESDFNICVVLPASNEDIQDHVRHLAWEIAFDEGTAFYTLVLSTEEFERGPMSESTLVENILREGIAA